MQRLWPVSRRAIHNFVISNLERPQMNFLPKLVYLGNKSLEICLFHAPLAVHTAQGWPLWWPVFIGGTHRPLRDLAFTNHYREIQCRQHRHAFLQTTGTLPQPFLSCK